MLCVTLIAYFALFDLAVSAGPREVCKSVMGSLPSPSCTCGTNVVVLPALISMEKHADAKAG